MPFHPHDYPLALTLFSYVLACVVIIFVDRFALPKRVRKANRIGLTRRDNIVDTLVCLPVIALIFAFFFAISWRPLYAAAGAISFFVIFMGISRVKFRFIREPLIFSDIALVADVFKYKTIFYATKLNAIFWLLSFVYVFGASAAYMILEPSVLPQRAKLFWVMVMIGVAAAPWILLFYGPVNKIVATLIRPLVRQMNVRASTARFGTFCSVFFHFVAWLGMKRAEVVAEISERLYAAVQDLIGHGSAEKAPLILVWQSESFIDMRHFGVSSIKLPNIDRMKRLAAQWGRLSTVFEGGYTLRTEFAVLSGLVPDDLHVDAAYPYLRASHYGDLVWPMKLKNAGWSTHFIHPYSRTFFFRHKAMPQLGFQKMTMLDAFDHVPARDGPYVSDETLTRRVIDEVKALKDTESSLIFVASMANHGPWEPGRVEGLNDPVSIYLDLLQKSDAALGRLIDFLGKLDRPVWFVFYGDHAPLLKSFADPFPDPRTDYFILPLADARTSQHGPVFPRNEEPWDLIRALLRHAKLSRKPLTADTVAE
ncbi:LTA synthase family protein [Ensifer soli]|uniref:LTA synthase family protein n=1 Tax=Ciceribacter sp. sgz301302 TaxID=3342379 RepID=UPI0035B959FD